MTTIKTRHRVAIEYRGRLASISTHATPLSLPIRQIKRLKNISEYPRKRSRTFSIEETDEDIFICYWRCVLEIILSSRGDPDDNKDPENYGLAIIRFQMFLFQ